MGTQRWSMLLLHTRAGLLQGMRCWFRENLTHSPHTRGCTGLRRLAGAHCGEGGVCGEGVKGFSTNTELLTVSFGSGGVWRGLWAYCMKLANRGGWRRPLDAIYGRDSAREDNTRGRYCVLWHYHTQSKQIEKGVSGGSWFRGGKRRGDHTWSVWGVVGID